MSFSAPPAPDEYLELATLMSRWHVSRTTLWRWAKHGIPDTAMRLNPIRLGRRVLVRRLTVEHIETALALAASPARPARRRRRRSPA